MSLQFYKPAIVQFSFASSFPTNDLLCPTNTNNTSSFRHSSLVTHLVLFYYKTFPSWGQVQTLELVAYESDNNTVTSHLFVMFTPADFPLFPLPKLNMIFSDGWPRNISKGCGGYHRSISFTTAFTGSCYGQTSSKHELWFWDSFILGLQY